MTVDGKGKGEGEGEVFPVLN